MFLPKNEKSTKTDTVHNSTDLCVLHEISKSTVSKQLSQTSKCPCKKTEEGGGQTPSLATGTRRSRSIRDEPQKDCGETFKKTQINHNPDEPPSPEEGGSVLGKISTNKIQTLNSHPRRRPASASDPHRRPADERRRLESNTLMGPSDPASPPSIHRRLDRHAIKSPSHPPHAGLQKGHLISGTLGVCVCVRKAALL